MATRKSRGVFFGFFIIACLLVSQQLFAQPKQMAVPVEKEPHHRIVFENKNVRIYDMIIPPGDVSLFHTHSFDNLSIVISGEVFAAGLVMFSRATNASYTHQIGNKYGTTPLRIVGVEVLASSASRGVPAALDTVPGHQLVLQNDLIKVYRLFVDPKQSTGVRSRTLPWLRISISQGMISISEPGKTPETLETKPGDYHWYDGPTMDSIENVGSTKYEAIEIELQ